LIPSQKLKAIYLSRLDIFVQDPLLKYISVEYIEYIEIFKEKYRKEVLSKYQSWDYKIKLEEGKILSLLLIILLSETRLQILKEYLDKILEKGFI
jgi:hypothetical protein